MTTIIIIGLAVVFFWPTIMAVGANHDNTGWICVLNIVLGWTILGWILVIVLVILTKPKKKNEMCVCKEKEVK
jgi:hypothetical protein